MKEGTTETLTSRANDVRVIEAESIFDAIVDLPPEDRAAALESRCGGDGELRAFVERLLRFDDKTSTEFHQRMAYQPTPVVRGPQPPFEVGRYKVVRTLGEGGMGTVYEAEQDHPQRIVALKLMMRGICSRSAFRRFEHEAQILARLRHPGIAHVYDVGVHEEESKGSRQERIKASRDEDAEPLDASMPRSLDAHSVPYFVMEYIPSAKPITEYARTKNLDTSRRLELFIRVCDAVHHGHQKGIIHRDLKPGNILVDSGGQPKIIDFGVARATDSDMAVTTMQTDVGQLIGTLQYMSPEQFEADPHDLDVRSDVYALGVVLYELLTEQLPYDVAAHPVYEAARVIRETEPPRPSTLNRTLRGDLETITLKALEKDRERRYQSAADLSEDIRRYLSNRSILARPPSAMYQFRTFARRNKTLVGGVTATFIALIAGLLGVSAMYVQAVHLRAGAEDRARETEKVAQFQAGMLRGIDLELMGARLREDILTEASAMLERREAGSEDVAFRLTEIERSLAGVNFTNAAVKSLERNVLQPAIEHIQSDFADEALIRAHLLQTMADVLRGLGRYDTALPLQEDALAIRRQLLGYDHPDTLTSIGNIGRLYQGLGEIDLAIRFSTDAMEGRRRVLGVEHPDTLGSINVLGFQLIQAGRYGEAERHIREALEVSRRTYGNEHRRTLLSIANMGTVLEHQGRYAEAEPYDREALEIRRRLFGDDHLTTLISMNHVGLILALQGKFTEAEPYFRESLEGRRRALGDEHPTTLILVNNMGFVLRQQGRLSEAEQYVREALEARQRLFGEDHPQTLISINHMGHLLKKGGHLAEAEPYLHKALQARQRILGDDHPETLVSMNLMGNLLRQQGSYAKAEEYVRTALEVRRRVLGPEHPDTLESINSLAGLLRDIGRLEDAERLGAEAVQGARHLLTTDHWTFGVYLADYARTFAALARYEEAEERMLKAHAIVESSLGEQHPRTIDVIEDLAVLYDTWHERDPEAGHDATAAEWRSLLASAREPAM